MINWMFTWLTPAGTLSHDDMAPIVADLFLGGLGAVRPPPPVLVEARGLNRRPISQ
jgi:hypothetical protein